MKTNDSCANSVRFKLSEENGEMTFVSFDIIDCPHGHEVKNRLREYLVGRPLASVTRHELAQHFIVGDDVAQLNAVADMIEEYQDLFTKTFRDCQPRPQVRAKNDPPIRTPSSRDWRRPKAI